MFLFMRNRLSSLLIGTRHSRQSRCYSQGLDIDGDPVPYGMKTKVDVLNEEEEGVMFNGYSPHGFLLNNGMRLPGPIAVFPKTVLQWNVRGAEHVTEDSLTLFTLLEPKPDLLIIGVGDVNELHRINPSIVKFMRSHKINVELLSTVKAIQTFNFLNSEKRLVVAAVIPPQFVSVLKPEADSQDTLTEGQNLSIDQLKNRLDLVREQRQLPSADQAKISKRPKQLTEKSKTDQNDESQKDS